MIEKAVPEIDPKQTREYAEGHDAFLNGKSDCPYSSQRGFSNKRFLWWVGWLDTRTRRNLRLKGIE